jgi:hypothetical protein
LNLPPVKMPPKKRTAKKPAKAKKG